jgi:hypothetical protein
VFNFCLATRTVPLPASHVTNSPTTPSIVWHTNSLGKHLQYSPGDFSRRMHPFPRSALSERIEIWETIAQKAGGRTTQRFGGARQRS